MKSCQLGMIPTGDGSSQPPVLGRQLEARQRSDFKFQDHSSRYKRSKQGTGPWARRLSRG